MAADSSSADGEGRAAARTRLGVLGWPVAHSLSPRIHNAALAAAGLTGWRYQLLPVPPDLLAEVVMGLPGAGFRGANVTIPHKEAALALATRPSQRAAAIGAANTLIFQGGGEGEVVADNTDAPALIAALPEPVVGASALVLGAGGSARAVVWALLDAGAVSVAVWNRSPERARRLCSELGGTPTGTAVAADVLVNCTSVGLDGSESLEGLPLDAGDLADYGCIVDLVYRPGGTGLTRAARAVGRPIVDGLELLVGQGALSFEQFTGRGAPVSVMRAAAREPAAHPTGG
ncbi:MAG: shikimate dehydrogenase family protein [Solirubrobacteraceae bacterium]